MLERAPHARLVVVGFGAYREGLERLMAALASGDLDQARQIALAGRSLEDPGSEPRPLRHLLAFLDSLLGQERERYLAEARALIERGVLTGLVEHDELAQLLPACEALVVPNVCGPSGWSRPRRPPWAAAGQRRALGGRRGERRAVHAVPEQSVPWLSFPVDDEAIRAVAARLCGWLGADSALRSRTRAGLVATARERWSWEGVARGVIAAARGELQALQEP